MAIFIPMITETNIATLKNHLCDVLEQVAQGQEVIVCKRNVPVARLTPFKAKRHAGKRPVAGCMKGTVNFLGPVTGPVLPEADWNMLRT